MQNYNIIFTDGACSGNPGPGGWGAVVLSPTGEVRELGGAENPTTNNRMELTAVNEALRLAQNNSTQIHLFTDSTYVIKGATEWVWGWQRRGWKTMENEDVANQDLWQEHLQITRNLKIKWGYVRGHQGQPGNERCDAIAVAFSEGRSPNLYIGPVDSYSISLEEPPLESPPTRSAQSSAKKEAYSYLSYVSGQLRRHKTWSECEARVKGQRGARYKKAVSAEDEIEICRQWNVDPTKIQS